MLHRGTCADSAQHAVCLNTAGVTVMLTTVGCFVTPTIVTEFCHLKEGCCGPVSNLVATSNDQCQAGKAYQYDVIDGCTVQLSCTL